MSACIALAGNPNCGKTTLFNACTGARQHVGNYPGVTVEKKEGTTEVDGKTVRLLDLPGAYSLTAWSEEERVAREVLTAPESRPHTVINIVDAAALERNLYLTVQLLEMGIPVVLACNMMDEAAKAGVHVDIDKLAHRLQTPVVATVARTGEGLPKLLRVALHEAESHTRKDSRGLRISYGCDVDPVLADMEERLMHANAFAGRYTPRWLALKVLEDDPKVLSDLETSYPDLLRDLLTTRRTLAAHLKKTLNTSPESVIADFRYGYIRGILRDGTLSCDATKNRLDLSDKLDKIFINPLLGPVIMLAVMYIMFQFTFQLGAYPQGWVEDGFAWLGETTTSLLPEGLLSSLIVSGVIDGVGGVVGFVPLIMIMFLFVAFLEDSGYMSRIAFMLDRVFRAFGLHGCSVMPYIISGGIAGGCAIPGVMATRTLRSPKEKLATLLTLPYMACGAKLPVFLLLAGVFFPGDEAMVLFLLTLAGWASALLIARLLRSTCIRGSSTPLVMELPPYRMPTIRSLSIHCWERTWMYLKKAGTVLVAVSILIWAAMTFPALPEDRAMPFETQIASIASQLDSLPMDTTSTATPNREALESELAEAEAALSGETLRYSVAGRLGTALETVTAPAGFDWRTNIALIAGIAAKEAIVSSLGTAYSLGEEDPEDAPSLAARLAQDPGWSKATALSLMLFVLLYAPCFVALVVIRQEAGSWLWVGFSLVFNTAFAFGVAMLAHRLGTYLWA